MPATVALSRVIYDCLLESLLARQGPATGGWGYRKAQDAVEPTCLALLALRGLGRFPYPSPEGCPPGDLRKTRIARALERLEDQQKQNGGWTPIRGDGEAGCWTTALAAITLLETNGPPHRVRAALRWLSNARGRESNWLWRWKFRTVDTKVRFDPAKFGWSWVPGTVSWVIPTAFSVIALRKARQSGFDESGELSERVDLGVSMLFDRMCPGGGWNSGNGTAFGVAIAPYIDATAIALLALIGYETDRRVSTSLRWLVNRLPGCPSPYSLAWGILALSAYRPISTQARECLPGRVEELVRLIENSVGMDDNCTLAMSALALEAIHGENVFEVRA